MTQIDDGIQTLRCMPKLRVHNDAYPGSSGSFDYNLHVLTLKAVPIDRYEMMCATIDDFLNAQFAESILDDIAEVESGKNECWEEGTEAYMFWITREGVTFEFQHGEHGPEKGGEVTLAQFKLAVQTYLQFLRDPDRKPIEVPFPQR